MAPVGVDERRPGLAHLVGDRAEHAVVDDPRRLGALVVAEGAHGRLGHAGTVGDRRRRRASGFSLAGPVAGRSSRRSITALASVAGLLRVVGLGDVGAGLGQRPGHDVGEGDEGLPLDGTEPHGPPEGPRTTATS